MNNMNTNWNQFTLLFPRGIFAFTLIGLLFIAGLNNAIAQRIANGQCGELDPLPGNARTVLVEPDNYPLEVGSLNNTIEDDAAERAAHDGPTVYLLEKDTTYWLSGTLTNEDFKLWIRPAEGDGHIPIIRPATDELGESHDMTALMNDTHLECIYINAYDDAGIFKRYMGPLRMIALEPSEFVFDRVWISESGGNQLVVETDGHSISIKDSFFKNQGPSGSGSGRWLDIRGANVDSLVVKNTTVHNSQAEMVRSVGDIFDYIEFDHVTMYGVGQSLTFSRVKELVLTNSIFYTFGVQSQIQYRDDRGYVEIEPFEVPVHGMEDADRKAILRNNNIGFTRPDVVEFFDEVGTWTLITEEDDIPPHHEDLYAVGDSLPRVPYHTLDSTLTSWQIDEKSNTAFENNFAEELAFDNEPDLLPLMDYVAERVFDVQFDEAPLSHDDVDNRSDEPVIHTTTAANWRNFAYLTEAGSYTAGDNGYPLGDLNWFPELRERWEAGDVITSIDEPVSMVQEFRLVGNYPNPFNPTTNIVYELSSPVDVRMEVYNTVGQKMATHTIGMQNAGRHELTFDASHLSSGMYIVRLHMGEVVQTINTTLIK